MERVDEEFFFLYKTKGREAGVYLLFLMFVGTNKNDR